MGSRLLQTSPGQTWQQALRNPTSNGARAVFVLTAAGIPQEKIGKPIGFSTSAVSRFINKLCDDTQCDFAILLAQVFQKGSPPVLDLVQAAKEADPSRLGPFFEQLIVAINALDAQDKARLATGLLQGYASHPQLLNKKVTMLPLSLVKFGAKYPSLLAVTAACGVIRAAELGALSTHREHYTVTLGDIKVTVNMPVGSVVTGELNGHPIHLPPQ